MNFLYICNLANSKTEFFLFKNTDRFLFWIFQRQLCGWIRHVHVIYHFTVCKHMNEWKKNLKIRAAKSFLQTVFGLINENSLRHIERTQQTNTFACIELTTIKMNEILIGNDRIVSQSVAWQAYYIQYVLLNV